MARRHTPAPAHASNARIEAAARPDRPTSTGTFYDARAEAALARPRGDQGHEAAERDRATRYVRRHATGPHHILDVLGLDAGDAAPWDRLTDAYLDRVATGHPHQARAWLARRTREEITYIRRCLRRRSEGRDG